MFERLLLLRRSLVSILSIAVIGCSIQTANQKLSPIPPVPQSVRISDDSPFLKVHMKDGSLYVLSQWEFHQDKQYLTGEGKMYDGNRTLVKEDSLSILIQDIALCESNVLEKSDAGGILTLMTGVSAALTVYCIANPKACFGSCPTFYAWDGNQMRLQAEGFSASILPVLEAVDIDALYFTKPEERNFKVKVTNEALETHMIRYANILAVKRESGERIYVSGDNTFFKAKNFLQPMECKGPEGDCLSLLLSMDRTERFSLADSFNLAEKEFIEVRFDHVPQGELGVVVGFRESLLTTYLLYQTLAYFGNSAGEMLARYQTNYIQFHQFVEAMRKILGGIEIQVKEVNGDWKTVGEINEPGPIATNIEIMPLPQIKAGVLEVRLRMSKGLWRLNYIALASISKADELLRIRPTEVQKEGVTDVDATQRLLDENQLLITQPGDVYTLSYELPEQYDEYEYFLESKGYYLEWIRKEWIAEENPAKVFQMFTNPQAYLCDEAPKFKSLEPTMEETFWRSKYEQYK